MSYAVIRVEDFALHALVRAEPGLAGRPVALVEGEGRRARVREVSAQAVGVAPGLAATLAMSRCPGIVLRTREPAAETEASRLLIAAAFTLSPRVEATGAGCCTVDLQGAEPARTESLMRARALELAGAGLPARLGAGDTPILAFFAARQADPVLVVRDAQPFLAPLPLDFAQPSAEQARILGSWGISTLGGLTALSKAEVGERLGSEGALLWERASGRQERVLRLVEADRSFAAQWDYDPPVESVEPLFFRLRRFAERVALELKACGLAAGELALTLLLEDESDARRTFRLPEPSCDVEAWMRVIGSHLSGVRTEARVVGVRLVAAPARPLEKQDGLFDTGLRDPALFWENLARLAAIVGNDRVGTPVCADTHRPDVFTLERPAESVEPAQEPVHGTLGATLRRFRPPWPVAVHCREGVPSRLSGRLEGAVRAVRGPWRSSGDWWRADAWECETWHVELAAGGVYLLAADRQGWRVEGMLD